MITCPAFPSGTLHKKLLTCRSLLRALSGMSPVGLETVVLEIGLHVDPKSLKETLAQTIAELDEEGTAILLGYGLCGRATEGLKAEKSTLVLPRVDDCVGALLGSRSRHRQLLLERAGTYFLDPDWIGTEIDLFSQFGERLTRYPPERREKLIAAALKNYTDLALLSEGDPGPAGEILKERAARFNLRPVIIPKDLGLLYRLLNGPWEVDEFIVTRPGEAIPMFQENK